MSDILTVHLEEKSYPIYFEKDITNQVQTCVDVLSLLGKKPVFVTDINFATLQKATLSQLARSAPTLVLPAGETTKSLHYLGVVLDFLAQNNLNRDDVVFAVGGGVIGDLVGFAAATYLRGISYYQVPTTLLAMVDSSVGGKTAINLEAGKNLVGAFHQPSAVFIGTNVLETLPPREFAAGCAEIIKMGFIKNDKILQVLEKTPLTLNHPNLVEVIKWACTFKASLVEADEFETFADGRILLNLGHTVGHAIEQTTGYGTYVHGEAVAIGLVAAAHLSAELKLVDKAVVDRVKALLLAHHLPVALQDPVNTTALLEAMLLDKKMHHGLLQFIVLNNPGLATTHKVNPEVLRPLLKYIGAN